MIRGERTINSEDGIRSAREWVAGQSYNDEALNNNERTVKG